MTKIQLISGTAWTALQVAEVRQYLQGGSRGGTISGFADEGGTIPVIINVHAIEYIYE